MYFILYENKLCEVLAILNKYEDENTSLAEALNEIKELKIQLEKKNQHIEDLVDVINRLEMENSRYEEAILVLRYLHITIVYIYFKSVVEFKS